MIGEVSVGTDASATGQASEEEVARLSEIRREGEGERRMFPPYKYRHDRRSTEEAMASVLKARKTPLSAFQTDDRDISKAASSYEVRKTCLFLTPFRRKVTNVWLFQRGRHISAAPNWFSCGSITRSLKSNTAAVFAIRLVYLFRSFSLS